MFFSRNIHNLFIHECYPGYLDIYLYGAVAQWYSQCTSVLEVAGLIPTPDIVVIVIVLTENQSQSRIAGLT